MKKIGTLIWAHLPEEKGTCRHWQEDEDNDYSKHLPEDEDKNYSRHLQRTDIMITVRI